MTRPNGYLWKKSVIPEVNNFLSMKLWIMTKRRIVKAKGIKPVPGKWVFKSKEEPNELVHLNSIKLVKGYMQVPGVDFTESFSLVISYTSTSIMIGITLYHK